MSAKKKISLRRVLKVKEGVSGSLQSAGERNAAETELQGLIAKYAPEHGSLVTAVRRSLRKLLPTAHEVVYEYGGFFVVSYSPSGHGYEGVVAIHASADGVKLYFNHGKDLPDPENLLQGSAQARWIGLEGMSTLARPAVKSLIDEAIACSSVPFASDGRGSVMVRLTAAKKRGRGT